MKSRIYISLIITTLMLSAAIGTRALTPTSHRSIYGPSIALENMIPLEFGQWKIATPLTNIIVNNEKNRLIDKIYNQTISRTYINNSGNRVMLSIAYGSDQSTDLHVHRPELCYLASGFEIGKIHKTLLITSTGQIPAMQLVAKNNARNEPITYWIRVGDSLTQGWIEQKFTALLQSLTGKVPDGLLFRVSTITNNENESYLIQQDFVSDMLQAIKPEDRRWLVGQSAPLTD
jgi:EpsI family protein